jgi:transposase-like protein
MRRHRPALFRGRHFEAEIIVLCVRWYLRFGLSFRNLEELMAERKVSVDHVTISGAGSRDTPRNYTDAAARNCG